LWREAHGQQLLGIAGKRKQSTIELESRKGTETANVAYDEPTGPQVELLLSNIDEELLTFASHQELLQQLNIWIGDTAATVHMSPHEEGMINIKKTRGGITVGNGEVMAAKKTGDIPCEICDKYGKTLTTGLIADVALTKNSPFNLFSVTKMMRQDWKLGGDNVNGITLEKKDKVRKFDIPIETPKGVVYAMYVRRSEIAAPVMPTIMNIEKAHRVLGHQSEEATRKTAKYFGWTITRGGLQTCLPCTVGKAKQKSTVKHSKYKPSGTQGERIFTDIASIRPVEGVKVNKPHWCIKVD
jgi:hypothetical protein